MKNNEALFTVVMKVCRLFWTAKNGRMPNHINGNNKLTSPVIAGANCNHQLTNGHKLPITKKAWINLTEPDFPK